MSGIYPQGEVYSMHQNQIHFESEQAPILKKTKNSPIQIIFGLTPIDHLDSFKHHFRVYLKEYQGAHDLKTIMSVYNEFYKS